MNIRKIMEDPNTPENVTVQIRTGALLVLSAETYLKGLKAGKVLKRNSRMKEGDAFACVRPDDPASEIKNTTARRPRRRMAERKEEMEPLTVVETTYVVIEPGMYDAKVKAMKYETGEYGRSLKITFKLLDNELGPDEDELIAYASVERFSRNCKAYKWLTALSGEDWEPKTEVDPEDYVGQRCRVVVDDGETKKGDKFSRIEKVLPPKKQREMGEDENDDIPFGKE